jgi:transcriptional/translational regulatory protein YebC/TACO1
MKQLDPVPTIELTGVDLEQVEGLLDALEDHDEVVEVWSNKA